MKLDLGLVLLLTKYFSEKEVLNILSHLEKLSEQELEKVVERMKRLEF